MRIVVEAKNRSRDLTRPASRSRFRTAPGAKNLRRSRSLPSSHRRRCIGSTMKSSISISISRTSRIASETTDNCPASVASTAMTKSARARTTNRRVPAKRSLPPSKKAAVASKCASSSSRPSMRSPPAIACAAYDASAGAPQARPRRVATIVSSRRPTPLVAMLLRRCRRSERTCVASFLCSPAPGGRVIPSRSGTGAQLRVIRAESRGRDRAGVSPAPGWLLVFATSRCLVGRRIGRA